MGHKEVEHEQMEYQEMDYQDADANNNDRVFSQRNGRARRILSRRRLISIAY